MNFLHAFYVKPAAHEIVETTVSLAADRRPALTGTVLGPDGKPAAGALVTLWCGDSPAPPAGALYTDELGRFAFGPLEPGQLYHVHVFQQSGNVRTLEQSD